MKSTNIGIGVEPAKSKFGTTKLAVRWLTALTLLALANVPASMRADMLVSSWGQGSILRYDENTVAYLGTFVSPHSGDLQAPTGFTFGPDNNLYVLDGTGNQILRYNGQTGAFVDVFSKTGFNQPYGIAFGSDGKAYVSNLLGKNIVVLDAQTGTFLGQFGTNVMQRPRDLKFGPDGALYVADGLSGVVRFDVLNGDSTIFVPPNNFSPTDGAFGLVFGADGNLYVSDVAGAQVRRFNGTTGLPIGTFASGCSLGNAAGVAFGPRGNLWVVSYNASGPVVNGVIEYNGGSGGCLRQTDLGVSSLQFLLFTPPLRVSTRISEVEIAWNSVSNATYRVDYKSSLTTNQWNLLMGCVQANGTTTRVYDKINIGDPQRFYRVAATNCVP